MSRICCFILSLMFIASIGHARLAVLPDQEPPAQAGRLLVANWLAECLKTKPEGWCLDIISELQRDENCQRNFTDRDDAACKDLGVISCALKTADTLPRSSLCSQLVQLIKGDLSLAAESSPN